MKTQTKLSNQWVLLGSISGIIANLLFYILVFVSLPGYLEVFFAAMFGVLYSLIGFGVHHILKYEKHSILTQVSAIFILISGFLFNIMLMIQLTFIGYLEVFRNGAKDERDLELLNWITKTVDPVHLGLQFSNDFFTANAMIMLAIVMYSHRFFGKIWSVSGATIAIALIIVKCYSFPFTPGEVGIPYVLGPLISFWFLAVCVQCLRKRTLTFSNL